MLLATGGEFAFVAFGEAVSKGVLPAGLTNELYMVVALSMALVPYLAALGGRLGVLFERSGEHGTAGDETVTMYARNSNCAALLSLLRKQNAMKPAAGCKIVLLLCVL